jgi:hypothetical protein
VIWLRGAARRIERGDKRNGQQNMRETLPLVLHIECGAHLVNRTFVESFWRIAAYEEDQASDRDPIAESRGVQVDVFVAIPPQEDDETDHR